MKIIVWCSVTTLMVGLSGAFANTPDFYKDKQLRLVVGYAATANDYDVGARLLARHLRKHIPGHPTVIVQNMPGASKPRSGKLSGSSGTPRRHSYRECNSQSRAFGTVRSNQSESRPSPAHLVRRNVIS